METQVRNAEFVIAHSVQLNHNSPLKWIVSHAIHYWYFALIAGIGAIFNGVFSSFSPILIGQAFTLLSAPSIDLNQLIWTAAAIVASQLVRAGVFQLARNYGFEFMAQKMERDIRQELYVSLLGKSMAFHNLQSVGDTMARATNDVREINFMFNPGLNLVVGSLVFLVVPVFVAQRYHPALVITPLVFIVFYFFALWEYLHSLKPVTNEVRASFGNLNSRLSEVLDGIETVKSASQEQTEIELFKKNSTRYRNALVWQGDVEARFIPLLLLSLAYAGGLLHSLYLLRLGLIGAGDVVAYFGTLILLEFPAYVSIFAYSQISLGLAGARRILELITPENPLDQNVKGHSQAMEGGIKFEDICFSYDQSKPTLEHISFNVKPGKTVAIVGQTGAGKTSLVRLINRTYDANCGQVLVDGVNVKDWNLESLRRNISIIEQDIFLFSKSIEENIAFGKPGASFEEIQNAAKLAQAHDFIMSFADGYKTVIGERGVTLSGGQRQRLALARAFLTDPRILILDDSTSAIDSATEDQIQSAIFKAAQGRTTLIITHRLSQIRWADLIIVLRKGKMEAMGTHDELLKTCEPYRRIFKR
jgi:ATP-binding cassette, subfamily B, bacterial